MYILDCIHWLLLSEKHYNIYGEVSYFNIVNLKQMDFTQVKHIGTTNVDPYKILFISFS